MRAAAHDPTFARKMKIPQDVVREFAAADKMKKGKRKRRRRMSAISQRAAVDIVRADHPNRTGSHY